jgi:hypothetical protein
MPVFVVNTGALDGQEVTPADVRRMLATGQAEATMDDDGVWRITFHAHPPDPSNFVAVLREKLFFWHSAAKTQVMFPGMKSKIGAEQYKDLCQVVIELEQAIGVIKGEQGFNGG